MTTRFCESQMGRHTRINLSCSQDGNRGAGRVPFLSMANRSDLAVRVSAALDAGQRRGRARRWQTHGSRRQRRHRPAWRVGTPRRRYTRSARFRCSADTRGPLVGNKREVVAGIRPGVNQGDTAPSPFESWRFPSTSSRWQERVATGPSFDGRRRTALMRLVSRVASRYGTLTARSNLAILLDPEPATPRSSAESRWRHSGNFWQPSFTVPCSIAPH